MQPHHKQAASLNNQSRHTDISLDQSVEDCTDTQADYMAEEICIRSLCIKYIIQQQAEVAQEQHLSTWTFSGEMRQQTGT